MRQEHAHPAQFTIALCKRNSAPVLHVSLIRHAPAMLHQVGGVPSRAGEAARGVRAGLPRRAALAGHQWAHPLRCTCAYSGPRMHACMHACMQRGSPPCREAQHHAERLTIINCCAARGGFLAFSAAASAYGGPQEYPVTGHVCAGDTRSLSSTYSLLQPCAEGEHAAQA